MAAILDLYGLYVWQTLISQPQKAYIYENDVILHLDQGIHGIFPADALSRKRHRELLTKPSKLMNS